MKMVFGGNVNLQHLTKSINECGIYTVDSTRCNKRMLSGNTAPLEIFFNRTAFFEDISTLALLALFIRFAATNRKKVFINEPKWDKKDNNNNRLIYFLNYTGFNDLLLNTSDRNNWHENVEITNYHPTPRLKSQVRFEKYIPLKWIDAESFIYDKTIDIWKIRPKIDTDVQNFYIELLVGQRFLSYSDVTIFLEDLYLELGWNIVLHSNKIAGKGYGILGGTIFNEKEDASKLSELKICFADLGMGIPKAIVKQYLKNRIGFHKEKKISNKEALIRWALQNEGSSRLDFPSETDKNSYRGLTLVSHTIAARGKLEIISEGGHITLSKTPNYLTTVPSNSYAKYSIPGTQILFNLTQVSKQDYEIYNLNSIEHLEIQYFCLMADKEGNPLNSSELSVRYIESLKINKDIVLFDVGFNDKSFRNLEYLIEGSISKFSNKILIFWNVNSSKEGLEVWVEFSTFLKTTNSFTIIISKNSGENYLVSKGKTSTTTNILKSIFKFVGEIEDLSIKVFAISEKLYNELNTLVNTTYITNGFNSNTIENGFYRGKVHLLSGGITSYYFALNKNISIAESENLRRWCNSAFHRIVDLSRTIHDKILIISFSSSIKDLAKRLRQETDGKYEIFLLLSYDTPNIEDIDVVIRDFKHIILLTDVISSCSHLMGIVEVIEKTKAYESNSMAILGIIVLVDASTNNLRDKYPFYFLGQKIKLLSCSKLLPESLDTITINPEYWIDPISKIPTELSTFRYPIDKRIELSINYLSNSNAIYIGHIIDSSRHSSVWVDVNCLLESIYAQEFEKYLFELIDQRLKTFQWISFKPDLILFPSGSGYLIKIISDIEKIDSMSHYEKTLKNILKTLSKKYKLSSTFEVNRNFDTFGNSVLARTANFEDIKNLKKKDILIIDDGMWSGRTSKSLIQIGRALGAERILIIPFVARLNISDILFWENLQEIAPSSIDSTDMNPNQFNPQQSLFSHSVKVCYIFPLILPLPYYRQGECPYEITTLRLEKKMVRDKYASKIASELIEELSGKTISNFERQESTLMKFWLRIRVFTELSHENDQALENLIDIIRNTSNYAEQNIIFQIYLEEWTLLRKSRLRQALGQILRTKAKELILNQATPPEAKYLPISFLRSQFTETFIMHLKEISEEIDKHLENSFYSENSNRAIDSYLKAVARLLIHIYTLSSRYRYTTQVKEALMIILNSLNKRPPNINSNSNTETRVLDLIVWCHSLLIESRPVSINESNIETVKSVFNLITQGDLKHKCWHRLISIGNQINALREGTFKNDYELLSSEYKDLIVDKLFNSLFKLHEFFIISSLSHGNLPDPEIVYLCKTTVTNDSDSSKALIDDYTALCGGLSMLSYNPNNSTVKLLCKTSAKILTKYIGGESSILAKHIAKLHQITVRMFIDKLSDESKQNLQPDFKTEVQVIIDNTTTFDLHKDCIFITLNLANKIISTIISNLKTHAFISCAKEFEAALKISITNDPNSKGDRTLLIEVKNNGNLLNFGNKRKQSPSTIELNNQLVFFQCAYVGPNALSDDTLYKVSHSVFFQIW